MASDPSVPQASNPLRRLLRFFRPASHESAMEALRDDIAGAIAIGHSGGAMEKDARDRLLGALDLSPMVVLLAILIIRQAILPPLFSSLV